MANAERELRVEKDMYVNEATLELLQRRIETDVKTGFWKWIGLPVGGAGILAILYVLIWGFPQYVRIALQNNPLVEEKIQTVATVYLQDPDTGGAFIGEQVKRASEPLVNDAVKKYLASEAGQQIIGNQTSTYFASADGRKLAEEAIKKQIKEPDVLEKIRAAVKDALKEEIAKTIQKKKTLLVAEIADWGQLESLDKQSIDFLDDFLRGDKPSRIIASGRPLVLTFVIGGGNRYVKPIIERYIVKLRNTFKEQFRHVLILDRDKRFLSLVDCERFKQGLNSELIILLNSKQQDVSTDEARRFLRSKFGPGAIVAISTARKLGDALTDSLWSSLGDDDAVAVVGNRGQFDGITSLNRLIDGLFV